LTKLSVLKQSGRALGLKTTRRVVQALLCEGSELSSRKLCDRLLDMFKHPRATNTRTFQ